MAERLDVVSYLSALLRKPGGLYADTMDQAIALLGNAAGTLAITEELIEVRSRGRVIQVESRNLFK